MEYLTIQNDSFSIAVNAHNGAVEKIILNNDPEQMNWVLESTENPWHSKSFNWGLGYANFSRRNKGHAGLTRWETAQKVSVENNCCHVLYKVGSLFIKWERSFLPDGRYKEKCIVQNPSAEPVYLDNLVFYTPFNDNYPDAEVCVKKTLQCPYMVQRTYRMDKRFANGEYCTPSGICA